MKKKNLMLLCGLMVMTAVASQPNREVYAEETEVLIETDTDENAEEATLEPVTPSDYLVKNVSDYVTLGDLSNLSVNQYTYEITDEMVEQSIREELESYGEETEVDRAAQEGDVVYFDMTSTAGGDETSAATESTYITLGSEEFGADFDAKIIGASTGDTLTFSIDYDEDTWYEEWMNQTVDFTVAITSICEVTVPEYGDDYVSEYTDYSTTDEYEQAVRDSLADEYEETSYSEAIEVLFDTAANQCTFSGYPQELYDLCREDLISFYSMFAGTTDEDEIFSTFGLTEEDVDTEVLSTVNRRLLISALCQENEIEVTEEEYFDYLNEYASYYGYDSAAAFEEDNTRDYMIWALYESKAAELLYESADVTEIPYSEEMAVLEDLDTEEKIPEAE